MHLWQYIDSGPNTAAYNMAMDEQLLDRAQAGDTTPVLRLYTWAPAAVSIGRFQEKARAVNEEACRKHGIDIVQRITGGRAVLHRKELTYSIIARTDNPLFPRNVLSSYRVIAMGLATGLRSLGLPAEIVSRGSRHGSSVRKGRPATAACFSSPSWYEIVINGKKIIGSAQRRLSGAFLQHGSILMDHEPLIEAEVITGESSASAATCITRELGREAGEGEIRRAVLTGLSQSLGIEFVPGPAPQIAVDGPVIYT